MKNTFDHCFITDFSVPKPKLAVSSRRDPPWAVQYMNYTGNNYGPKFLQGIWVTHQWLFLIAVKARRWPLFEKWVQCFFPQVGQLSHFVLEIIKGAFHLTCTKCIFNTALLSFNNRRQHDEFACSPHVCGGFSQPLKTFVKGLFSPLYWIFGICKRLSKMSCITPDHWFIINTHTPKDGFPLRDLLKRCGALCQKACSLLTERPPSRLQNPLCVLLYMKYGRKMNYTQHLFSWQAKYTRLVRWLRELLWRHTCSQCDKAVTPHLCTPTESFCLNLLLIHLIFHVAQCLTSHCRLHSQSVSYNVLFDSSAFNCFLHGPMCGGKSIDSRLSEQ